MATTTLKTTDRIIDASLALFNAKGFANVPLSAIATSIGISPGNLTYHFKSKNDIALAVFPQLQEALRQSKPTGRPFIPRDGVRLQIAIFRTMWRYRFFFNSLLQLLAEDRTMRRRYMKFEASMVNSIQAILDELMKQGYMLKTSPPLRTDLVARAWWLMWLSCLRFEQLESPCRSELRDSALAESIVMTISIVQQYFRQDVAEAMLAAVKEELPTPAPVVSARRGSASKADTRLRRRKATA